MGLDILVNNAGGSGSIGVGGEKVIQHGPFDLMKLDDLLDVVRVNLVGLLLVTRAVLPHMLQSGSGRIVNVASEGGKAPIPDLAVYNACKAGVIGFTRSLGAEIGVRGGDGGWRVPRDHGVQSDGPVALGPAGPGLCQPRHGPSRG